MRRQGRLFVTLIALAMAAACSRQDDAKVKADLRGAGHDVDNAAAGVGHDADVKGAEAQFRAAGRDAAKDFHRAAAEAKAAAHALAADTKRAAHDVTRPSNQDSSNQDQRDSSS
jgi:hypothetical protein